MSCQCLRDPCLVTALIPWHPLCSTPHSLALCSPMRAAFETKTTRSHAHLPWLPPSSCALETVALHNGAPQPACQPATAVAASAARACLNLGGRAYTLARLVCTLLVSSEPCFVRFSAGPLGDQLTAGCRFHGLTIARSFPIEDGKLLFHLPLIPSLLLGHKSQVI